MDKKIQNLEHKTRNNLIMLLIVVVIGLLGVLTSYRSFVAKENSKYSKEMVEIPMIQVALDSEENNTEHTLQVEFVLELEEDVKNSETAEELKKQIAEVLQGLDYDKVKRADGVPYIKDVVKEKISLSEEDLKNIYIVGLRRDNTFEIPDQIDERFKSKREEEVFKGLFPNMR